MTKLNKLTGANAGSFLQFDTGLTETRSTTVLVEYRKKSTIQVFNLRTGKRELIQLTCQNEEWSANGSFAIYKLNASEAIDAMAFMFRKRQSMSAHSRRESPGHATMITRHRRPSLRAARGKLWLEVLG